MVVKVKEIKIGKSYYCYRYLFDYFGFSIRLFLNLKLKVFLF